MISVPQSPSETSFDVDDATIDIPGSAPAATAPGRTVTLGRRGPALVLTAAGEFDNPHTAQWKATLQRLAQEAGPGGAIIDTTAVEFMDCRSLEALLDFHGLAASRHLTWVLVPSRAVARPLEALKIHSVVRRRSLSEALMHCLLHAPAAERPAAPLPG